jgi:integrase
MKKVCPTVWCSSNSLVSRALALLHAYRGPRIGEAAALRVGDLDLIQGRMTISKALTEVAGRLEEGPPKTEAGVRTVTLPPFLRDALTEHLAAYSNPKDPRANVFTMPGGGPGRKEGNGGPIRPNNFRKRAFHHAVIASGVDPNITPHDLRDTAATLAFSAGATVKEVSVMLGHANPAVTLRVYTGVLNSMSEQTDERLEAAFRAAVPAASGEVVLLAR